MRLSVIIPTYERPAVLERTLSALAAALVGVDAEVILINDSEKEIPLKMPDQRFIVKRNPGKGASAARNAGAAMATGDVLLFLDDDVIVSKENVERTLELHSSPSRNSYNFFWYFPPDLTARLSSTSFGRYLEKHGISSQWSRMGRKPDPVPAMIHDHGVASYYLSIERSLFLSTGGYEEKIPFAGVEDIVLAKKFREMNIGMFLSTTDIVYHNESDRVELYQVMERYRRASHTMNAAVKAGHPEFARTFSTGKKIVYTLFLPFKGLIYGVSRSIPNKKAFDGLYFRMVNLLLGLSSWQGHCQSR